MIPDILGNNGGKFIVAAGAVAIGLLCLVAVLWFIRNRPSSPFIRGGKNRQPRLAVLDAAAIDTRRRLVLVRRDDVEHLIMIGGPTDVVIESRITGSGQPAQLSVAAQPPAEVALARPSTERPLVERRPAPQPEMKAAPVSAMGQVLYGEGNEATAVPARAAQPIQSRPEAVTQTRQALPERTVSVQNQVRPQPAVTPPVSIETAKSPEDILDAARSRVLATNQPAIVQNPSPQPVPAAAITAMQAPAIQSQAVAQSQKDASALEFERILDAEITGDLGKLTADDVRVDGDTRTNAANSVTRQDPRLGGQGTRTEPSLEDEMNRMLNEIAANRKN